jgi:hypothetical protein
MFNNTDTYGRNYLSYSQAGKSPHPFHLLHVLLRYRLILQ